jgi:hypothetical protein
VRSDQPGFTGSRSLIRRRHRSPAIERHLLEQAAMFIPPTLVLKDVSKMRLLFIGLNLMCVGLGMVLTIALENWLRGNSYLWWLLLVLLLLLGVTTLGITVFVGTHKLTDGRKLNGPDAGA